MVPQLNIKSHSIIFIVFLIAGWVGFVTGIVSAGESYVNNNDGIVSDNISSLMWPDFEEGLRRDWDAAVKYCETLKLAGYQDWRLPEKTELLNLLKDASQIKLKYNHAKLGMRKSQYWTGTESSVFSSVAWYVDFYRGDTGTYHKQVKFFNRCVRNIEAVNSKSD